MVVREKDIEDVIIEWKLKTLPEMIKREINVDLFPKNIVSIIGPRQAGKTFFLYQIISTLKKDFENNILYVNFEDDRLKNLNSSHLSLMLKTFFKIFDVDEDKPIFLFLDEIQKVRDWELWLRRIYDSFKYHIFISGSSSKLLSREISTALRGRNIDVVVFPFTFKEFLRAKGITEENINYKARTEWGGKLLKLLESYVLYGSYPKVSLEDDEDKKIKILNSYFNAIFYKDLIERFSISNIVAFEEFVLYCINAYSKYISISKIYNYMKTLGLKCSKYLLLKFLNYVQQPFFLFPVEIYSKSIKNRKQYPKKIYCVDNGIIRAKVEEHEKGRIMENLVFRELLRKSEISNLFKIFYWKEYGKAEGKEVDFVVKEGLRIKQLIQVTYASDRADIEKRETDGLLKAYELFKKDKPELIIITWDYEDTLKENGKEIKCIPLWKWLLNI